MVGYLKGEITTSLSGAFSAPFLALRPEFWVSFLVFCGVSVPFASLFFNESFLSRCSRAGTALFARDAAAAGLRGDEIAGTCCSSFAPSTLPIGDAAEGVEPRGGAEASAMH